MTDIESKKLVAVLLGAFPQARTSEQTPAIYERMLRDLDHQATSEAIQRLLASSRFMPTIAEIRSAVLEAEVGLQRPGGEAWGDVIAAVHKFGIYRTPVFADPVVARCVDALGWTEICNSENQAADRARFIETYNSLASSNRRELAMPANVRRLPTTTGEVELRQLIANALQSLPAPKEPA